MAENKNSFILYKDLLHTLEKMPREKAGDLFVHILQYVNDMNPTTNDLIIELTFEPIKQQLKRDLRKWDKYIEKQSINGSKGGRPKNPHKPKKPTGLNENPHKPKKAGTVTVTGTVTVIGTEDINIWEDDAMKIFIEKNNKWWEQEVLMKLKFPNTEERDVSFSQYWLSLQKANSDKNTTRSIQAGFIKWGTTWIRNIKKDKTEKVGRVEKHDIIEYANRRS